MKINPIDIQIIWNRLIATCEEQAQVMLRSAFSPAVRESGDLSAGLFDIHGRMLAQAVTGTPGHINTMAAAVVHFFEKFPVDSMQDGDVYVTNDPWKASGHLHDVTVVTPAFHRGRVVGLFAATVHLVDVGGRGMGPDAQDIYEEGLQIPYSYLMRQGNLNQDLIDIMRLNSREPVQVEGDVLAIIAAGEEGAKRLVAILSEFGIEDLEEVGAHIIATSRAATERAIREVPEGTYKHSVWMDGYERPVEIVVALKVHDGKISLDFTGTSGISAHGINCPLAYTTAYSFYAVKCIVAPFVPSNYGAHSQFHISAPDNCIVNPLRPAPVAARHVVGHILPDAVLGCLAQALPALVPAETGMMWNPTIRGYVDFHERDRLWECFCLFAGGMGARPEKDGLSGTAFPSALKVIPAEMLEASVPLLVWRKELRTDSGGAGRYRGGLGQIIEIGALSSAQLTFQAMFERLENPAQGREGGSPGATGALRLRSGTVLRGKGQQKIPAGDVLVLELPGGGGYGPPEARSADAVSRDLREGYLSEEYIRLHYPQHRMP